jgi:uncharacterized Tic20 family protein
MAKILAFMALVVMLSAIVGGVMAWTEKEEKEDIFEGQDWD